VKETLVNRVRAVRALNHSSITTNTNTDGSSVGLDQSGADFRTAMLVVAAGAVTDGTYTAVPQESPTGSGSWTDVPADRRIGSIALNAANAVGEMGVIPDPGTAPFLRVRITSTGVTTGGAVQALWLFGSPSSYPVVRP